MPSYTTGTVSVTNGSANVNGASTAWNTGAITANWFITFDNSETWYQIQSVNTVTNLTLSTQYNGISQTGITYLAVDVIPPYQITEIYQSLFGTMPTSLPATSGILWNDHGAVSIT
jgi:hypothetical protein